MSTKINVTVDSGGLSDRAKQQQQAARQAQLEKERQQRIEEQGTEQRTAAQATQGRAADGTPLYSTGFKQPTSERRPAANRGESLPSYTVTRVVDRFQLVDVGYRLLESFDDGWDFSYVIDFPMQYDIQFLFDTSPEVVVVQLPLFSGVNRGPWYETFLSENERVNPADPWPANFPKNGQPSPIRGDTFDPSIGSVTEKITEKFNQTPFVSGTNYKVLPINNDLSICVAHGYYNQAIVNKQVYYEVKVEAIFAYTQEEGDPPVLYSYYWINETPTVFENTASIEFFDQVNFCKCFLVSASQKTAREISTPAAVRNAVKDTYGYSYYLQPGNIQTRFLQKYSFGVLSPNDSSYTGSVTVTRLNSSATELILSNNPVGLISYGTSSENLPTTAAKNPTTPGVYTWFALGNNRPANNNPNLTDAAWVKANYLANVETPKYGVRAQLYTETPETVDPYDFSWNTVSPLTNNPAEVINKVKKSGIPQNGSTLFDTRTWDWGNPEYCRQQALALGFTEADLTP